MDIKYSDICQSFYIDATESESHHAQTGIAGKDSQGSLAEFFITLGWSDKSTDGILPDNISTYNKWFYGRTGQKPKAWNRFIEDYKEEKYVDLLKKSFNQNVLSDVAKKLGLELGKGQQIKSTSLHGRWRR